jgi:hypothetical protein
MLKTSYLIIIKIYMCNAIRISNETSKLLVSFDISCELYFSGDDIKKINVLITRSRTLYYAIIIIIR